MVWAGLAIPLFLASGILKLIFGFAIKNPGPEDIFLEIVATVGGILVSVSLFSDARKKPKEEPEDPEPIPKPDTEVKEEDSGFSPEEVESWVLNELSKISEIRPGDIMKDDLFVEYCYDSLDQFGFKGEVNEHFGIDFDYIWKETDVRERTVQQVIDRIKELLAVPKELLAIPKEPLTRKRIEDCVRNLLEKRAEKLKTSVDILTLHFYNEAGLDSLDTVELVIDMNTVLGTDVDFEIIEKEGIRNGRELVEMVVKELVVY